MNRNRIIQLVLVVGMIAIVALGFVLGIQPQLAMQASADGQRATVEAGNTAQAATLAALEEDAANTTDLESQWAAASKSIPDGTGIPEYLREVDAVAAANGVRVTGLTIADAAPYQVQTATVDAGGSAEPTATVPQPLQDSRITAGNFAYFAVDLQVTGSYEQVLGFVNGLQAGDRLMLVTNLTTTKNAGDPNLVDATVSGLIYSLVAADQAAAVDQDALSATGAAAEAAG
ncbi:hypothetical protein ACDF64_01400 [Agromyces sp. MMS24-JH15]|uniref:hypothetical protein n=1 Tax=Agromyces sp. MMS24-JH15 TaxID=3243765 RepID=UPI003748EED4